jgi:ribosomal-protein-alanine N-acetyltransferase
VTADRIPVTRVFFPQRRPIRRIFVIETERLTIRRFAPSDYRDLYEYLSDPAVYVFEPGKPVGLEEARRMAEERAAGEDFWAVTRKPDSKLVGHLYFKQVEPKDLLTWELGYIFHPKFQHVGYASESAAALTGYAFARLGARRIMARCNPENGASWRLLERIGFRREGHFRKYGFVHRDERGAPVWTDAYEYSKLDGDAA